MQWDWGKNMGFSEAPGEKLYLPLDPDPDAPCAAEQTEEEDSLLSETRRLTALRRRYEDLQADAEFAVIRAEADPPFVYRRGGLLLALNPSSKAVSWRSELLKGRHTAYSIHEARVAGDGLTMGPQSFAVLEAGGAVSR